ncbi:MAG TPA: hypothetical protein ENH29_07305, partial [Bacteroidetes bacterium]|nr:hypothetical protein [Bacteroidota bacterium]
ETLRRIKNARIAVIGDFCLDVYWLLDISAGEISIETGKRTLPIREQRYSLGGAGNVVANLHDLGVGGIFAFGIVGDDPFGDKMLNLLAEKANCDNMLTGDSPSWQTLTYCKPMLNGEELSRLDVGNFNKLSESLASRLIDNLEHAVERYHVVIINEQVVSGIHTDYLRKGLAEVVKRYKKPVFLLDGRHVQGVYPAWLKMNDHEALKMCGKQKPVTEEISREEVLAAIEFVYQKQEAPLVVTRGGEGCVVRNADGISLVPGIRVRGEIDTVGAGDSFLAGLSAALAVGKQLGAAAQVGNLVSAVTIQKIGRTGTATPEEILALL